jgi:hypothetical protein
MLIDASISFVTPGTPISLVTGAGGSVRSNIIDILGNGVGQPPSSIIGNTSVFGSDMGVGKNRVELDTVVGTAFTTSDSATLNVQLQGAPDTGAGGGYQPGTWTTIVETGEIPASELTAQSILGRFPILPYPLSQLPRYLSLNFQVASGTSFTAGTIAFSVPTMIRDDLANLLATNNYTVANLNQ